MSAQTLLDWALQTGFSVSLLIIFVMAIRKPVARYLGAKSAYALWALPIIRLFIPAIPILPAGPAEVPLSFPPFVETSGVLRSSATAIEPAGVTTNWTLTLIIIWMVGVFIWLTWQTIRQARFQTNIQRTTRTATPTIKAKLAKVGKDMGINRLPDVRLSDQGRGPMVTGLWQPAIILPARFEVEFTPEQQIHALAHELSHIRHGDLWIAAAALIFRALNWPNPLVHLAAPHFRADQEAACDSRVIALFGDDRSTRTAYADTLIRAAKLSKHSAQQSIPLGLTISNPLKERLMILKTNPTQRRSLRIALAGAAGFALLATAPLTAAQVPTPPAPPAAELAGKSVEKKVMKWVTNENGIETKKHIEIETENGVTTAWEIDEIGNRIQVPVDSIDMPIDLGAHRAGKMRIMMKDGQHMSEQDIEVMISEAMEGMDIEEIVGADGTRKVIVKRLGPDGEMEVLSESISGHHGLDGQNVIVMESHGMVDVTSDGENSFVFHSGDHMKSKPDMMVDVASQMMDGVNTDDMDRTTRKKIEAAQKALKEAKEALADAK